jgi:hypothetical protein
MIFFHQKGNFAFFIRILNFEMYQMEKNIQKHPNIKIYFYKNGKNLQIICYVFRFVFNQFSFFWIQCLIVTVQNV